MARCFLGTKVIVYAVDRSSPDKHRLASDLLARTVDDGTASLSVQVLQEPFVTVTCKVAHPLAVDEASGLVSDLGALTVHRPGPADVTAAVDLSRRFDLSFWDAMIVRSATALGCDVLWSEDLDDGQSYDGIVVWSPFR